MKWDWKVEGTVVGTDSSVRALNAVWTDLTYDEAEAQVDALIKKEKRSRSFHGLSIRATGNKPGARGFSTIIRAEWKDG